MADASAPGTVADLQQQLDPPIPTATLYGLIARGKIRRESKAGAGWSTWPRRCPVRWP